MVKFEMKVKTIGWNRGGTNEFTKTVTTWYIDKNKIYHLFTSDASEKSHIAPTII